MANGRRRPARGNEGGFGAQEITQARIIMQPTFGPVCRIPRSYTFDLSRTASASGFFFDWSLSDVPNASEFTALFAQWRLMRSSITFTWRSVNEANPTRPIFYLALDPFASAAPASINEILERPNRTWSPNAQRTTLQLDVKAKALDLVASGAGASALVVNALAQPNQWYPTTSTGLSYGALLLWIEGWGASAGTITVKQDYWFCFRSSK